MLIKGGADASMPERKTYAILWGQRGIRSPFAVFSRRRVGAFRERQRLNQYGEQGTSEGSRPAAARHGVTRLAGAKPTLRLLHTIFAPVFA